MKYEVTTSEDGFVNLKLGLTHNVSFPRDCTVEDVIMGVTTLIEKVAGISAFELVNAVAQEFQKNEPVVIGEPEDVAVDG
jgi:hypothetical protein